MKQMLDINSEKLVTERIDNQKGELTFPDRGDKIVSLLLIIKLLTNNQIAINGEDKLFF